MIPTFSLTLLYPSVQDIDNGDLKDVLTSALQCLVAVLLADARVNFGLFL